MFKNLETYLEEISHFLSGREEREEILSEIRSHILEKAERESGPITETSLAKIIAAYGKPRQVAEKYLDGRPVIAPAFMRHLFRYTALLFAVHLVFIAFAVIFRKNLIVFPFLFIPRLGMIGALMYLPTAFLTDFGIVAMVLYLITRSGKEFKLPWPKFAIDLDEVKASEAKTLAAKIATMVWAGIMLTLTGVAVKLFIRFQTIFLISANFDKFRPLLMPEPGRRVSIIILAMLIAGTINRLVKLFTLPRRISCWVDATADGLALVLIGLLLRQHYSILFAVNLPPRFLAWINLTLTITLLFAALIIAIDLVANVVRLGRKRPGQIAVDA
jgi:hypothetical protein